MTAPRSVCRIAALACIAGVVSLGGGTAHAQVGATPPSAAEDEGVRRYVEGRKRLEAGDYAGALVELNASFQALPSPNTELLIGHAQRLGGERAAAAATYQRVIDAAGEKVRLGEERFQPTLEEAGRWSATLRASLVEVEIEVSGAPTGTVVTVGGATVSATPGPRGLLARLAHEPGAITATATTPEGRSVSSSADGGAGKSIHLALDLTAPAVATPSPAEEGGGLSAPPLPVWIAAGVGVSGLAVFGIFGAMSASAASDLDACAPGCPDALRSTADDGARDQTIANVGLVVGAAGLVSAGVLWWVLPSGAEATAASSKSALRVRVSPLGAADATWAF